MRYLKEFNEYEPKTDKVSEYKDLLDRKYNISEYQDFSKTVMRQVRIQQ